jgi:hypothetical protein
MEDNLIIFKEKTTLFFFKREKLLFYLRQMEDDLNSFSNGREPQFFGKYYYFTGSQLYEIKYIPQSQEYHVSTASLKVEYDSIIKLLAFNSNLFLSNNQCIIACPNKH